MKTVFRQHGFSMILLSRAMPILPEVTAWLISTIPYVLIISYAGSISPIKNPKLTFILQLLFK